MFREIGTEGFIPVNLLALFSWVIKKIENYLNFFNKLSE